MAFPNIVNLAPKLQDRLHLLKHLIPPAAVDPQVLESNLRPDSSLIRFHIPQVTPGAASIPVRLLPRVTFINNLSTVFDDYEPVVASIANSAANFQSIRDVALKIGPKDLAAQIDPGNVPQHIIERAGDPSDPDYATKRQNLYSLSLRKSLFDAEPSAVIVQMLDVGELTLGDASTSTKIRSIMAQNLDWDFRLKSVNSILVKPETLSSLPENEHPKIIKGLQLLSRLQAISPSPEMIPALMQINISSAFQVANMPKEAFLNSFKAAAGDMQSAEVVHAHATNIKVRNEMMLLSGIQSIRGTGIKAIDGDLGINERRDRWTLETVQGTIDMNTLFGDIANVCDCDECLSVHSAAAYYVELLQFLRNNNLDPRNAHTTQKTLTGTLLEKLFQRRPDLGYLKLTCKNTNTTLPYLDLAMEVMESFIAHAPTIDPFNVDGDTISAELLAEPKHVNLVAYKTLSKAVYPPIALPYSLPLTTANEFLKALGTTKPELLACCRSLYRPNPGTTFTPAELAELGTLFSSVQDRYADAEFLHMSQEEYVLVTGESFYPKRWFQITQRPTLDAPDLAYRKAIGLSEEPASRFGYSSVADLLSTNSSAKLGLCFVKNQLLPRLGITYVELLDLSQTWYMNPLRPTPGSVDEQVIHGIRYHYRLLQNMVDYTETVDMMKKYQKLIDFLSPPTGPLHFPIIRLPGIEYRRKLLLESILTTDDRSPPNVWESWKRADWTRWILTWFDRIGKTLVMASGEGPRLPFSGQLVLITANPPQSTTSPGPFNPERLHVGVRLPAPPQSLPEIKPPPGLSSSPLNAPATIPFNTTDPSSSELPVFTAPSLPTSTMLPELQSPIHAAWFRNAFGAAPSPSPAPGDSIATFTVIAGIHNDGSVADNEGNIIGFVTFDGRLVNAAGKSFSEIYPPPDNMLAVRPLTGDYIGVIDENGYMRMLGAGSPVVQWSGIKDTCSIDDTVLHHLDGTPLTVAEWEKLLVLLRLWKKTEWTVDETDCAIKLDTGDIRVTPEDIHRLGKMKQLVDLTSISISKLLPLWAPLDGQGATSAVYSELFLGYNARHLDNVFMPNSAGAVLSQNVSEQITAHVPILQATLGLSQEDIQAILKFSAFEDKLTVASITVLYRFRTFARILGVRPSQLPDIIGLIGDPFTSPEVTLNKITLWQSIVPSGFDVTTLLYICKDQNSLANPIAIPERTSLIAVKELRDIVLGINKDYSPNSTAIQDAAIEDLLRAKLGVLYSATDVDLIDRFLAGTGAYTTNAPKDFHITIPPTLALNFKYFATKGVIQVTGILSQQDLATLRALGGSAPPNIDWLSALDRTQKQIKLQFDQILGKFSTFPSRADAILNLMSPSDLLVHSATPVVSTLATRKRRYFLQYFIPFLRKQLLTTTITASISTIVGLTNEVCQFLLTAALTAGTASTPALDSIIALGDATATSPLNLVWSGYLSPPTSGFYVFYIGTDSPPPRILLDRQVVTFVQQEDPTNLWISNPINLSGEALYHFNIPRVVLSQLEWSYGIVSRSAVPQSTLLAVDTKQRQVSGLLRTLQKFSILINKLNLGLEELVYLHSTKPIDFSNFSIASWKRLRDYKAFVNSVQSSDMFPVELFKWASTDDTSTSVASAISSATGWPASITDQLVSGEYVRRSDLADESTLLALAKPVQLAQKLRVDIEMLFEWAKPRLPGNFAGNNIVSDQVQSAFRKRFTQSEWNIAVKPVFDVLRSSRQSALVAYLLGQDSLRDKVADADGLFEYFLIDCQMSPLMETSRIKQAISTVQLFVQRCLLGLEDPLPEGVTINRQRWEALMNYRPWEASVKIRLWPENWCEPSIRDDRSPLFRDFESELMETGLSNGSIVDAFKNYLTKVQQISRLRACGIFVERAPRVSVQYILNARIHLFARTVSIPSTFFYRRFNVSERTWTAWEDMKIDIPIYEDSNVVSAVDIGTYLIPTLYEGRLLVFFPQFCKKTTVKPEPSSAPSGVPSGLIQLKPSEMWEIKMCWSEYSITESGLGKWSTKRSSEGALYTAQKDVDGLGSRSVFRFTPNLSNGALRIDIIHHQENTRVGSFIFTENSMESDNSVVEATAWNWLNYHLYPTYPTLDTEQSPGNTEWRLFSLQQEPNGSQPFFGGPPYVNHAASALPQSTAIIYEGANHILDIPEASSMLGAIASGQSLDPIGDVTKILNAPTTNAINAFGGTEFHELRLPNSIYFWEVGFHAIYHVTEQLLKSQQFEAALKMCQKIFDPLERGQRVWKFLPFRRLGQDASSGAFEASYMNLPSGEVDIRALEWRNNPFRPHVVARGTPVAYMKMVVMKYVEILIAWGDDYFRRGTLEALPSAMQCYIYASHIFGPKGQVIPRRGTKTAQTYMSLLNKWDALSNAMVGMELSIPTNSNSITLGGFSDSDNMPVAPAGASSLFGFATTLYFCVPNNPQFKAMRNTIDDRLFKIRNSQDIDGLTRKLPLFEPPIDPALLIQAKANGQSIYNALSDLNTPISPYRMHLILQKAIELCQEAISFSHQMLTIKERRDAESLALLQYQQEKKIRSLVMDIRLKQLDEAKAALEALLQNRKASVYRLKHQFKLLGIDTNTVPTESVDFHEIEASIDAPVKTSPINMISEEKQQIDEVGIAKDLTVGIASIEAVVAFLHGFPSISIACEPWGVGANVSFGPEQLSALYTATARVLQGRLSLSNLKSNALNLTGTAKRQAWDRFFQANVSGYEIKNIDKQVLAQRIRIDMSAKEVRNQQQSIDHAVELDEFLHSKYTNLELYSWMEGSVRSVHHQAYLFAYDMALKAQKAYRFERPNDITNFISSGYWNSGRDGLLAAQFLLNDLRKLQAASQEKRGYDFEIAKHVSLRQWCPLALFAIRETGTGEFEFPEIIFDMDFPGHYLRRINSVSVTMSCLVGPYTSVNATVQLLDHKYRIRPEAADYPEKFQDSGDDRFATTLLPSSALALSSGVNDSGRLDLKAAAETYNPIEGAGVISRWRLELPRTLRQFDYSTISDIIVHVNYTSLSGGESLKAAANASVAEYIKSVTDLSRDQGLFAIVDLKADYATQWFKSFDLPTTTSPGTPSPPANVILHLDRLQGYMPNFARHASRVLATDVFLLSSGTVQGSLTAGGTPHTFGSSAPVGKMQVLSINGVQAPISEWTVNLTGVQRDLEECWLVWRFTILAV